MTRYGNDILDELAQIYLDPNLPKMNGLSLSLRQGVAMELCAHKFTTWLAKPYKLVPDISELLMIRMSSASSCTRDTAMHSDAITYTCDCDSHPSGDIITKHRTVTVVRGKC